jgi:hypothetical protein
MNKKTEAQELIESHRGHYILSQSLLLAIDSMNRRPQIGSGDGQLEREPSNLADMKLLYTQIFNMYPPAHMIPDGSLFSDNLIEEASANIVDEEVEITPENVINLDNFRSAKHD